jgi:hypothetical protein
MDRMGSEYSELARMCDVGAGGLDATDPDIYRYFMEMRSSFTGQRDIANALSRSADASFQAALPRALGPTVRRIPKP